MRFGKNEPKRRHHPRVGQGAQSTALRFPKLDLNAKQYSHDTLPASDVTHFTAIAVDQHCHSFRM
jgi:hypothetical protein